MTETTLIRDLTVKEFRALVRDTIMDDTPKQQDGMLSLQEAADFLGVTKRTVMNYVNDPKVNLSATYFGNSRPRFRREDVVHFGEEHKPRQRK